MATDGGGRYRATPVQERFWLLHELHPSSACCNEAIVLRIGGQLEREKLVAALDSIVARHDALRTCFVQREGSLHACILARDTPCPFAFTDLASVAPVSEAILAAHITRAARARFDVTTAPLLRAALFRLQPELHVLVLVGHHAVIDGKSIFDLLPRELARRYAASTDEPTPALSFAQFAAQARAAESSAAAPADLEYWRAALEGAPRVLPMPFDRPHPARPSLSSVRANRSLTEEQRTRVQVLASQLGVRPFDVTCAAFMAQLMRYAGQLDVVIGSPVGKRGKGPELAGLIGCCIDTVLLRARFDAPPTFAELAHAIHSQRRASAKHSALSFGTLLDALGGVRDPARNPLYQAMFNYMDFAVADIEFPGLEVHTTRHASLNGGLDLSLDVIEQGSGYLLSLDANADVFDRAHVERMLSHFVTLLDHALRAASTSITALCLLDSAELEAVSYAAHGPALSGDRPELFHVELWKRASAFPDHIALRSGRTTLSYAALYARVAGRARRLIAAGVRPGERVLVPTRADPADTVVELLAVLAAGGAFVVLDSNLPEPRQRMIKADCGARFSTAELEQEVEPETAAATMPTVADLSADHPAYVLYTSGSTGRPKGVIVRHANLTHQLHARLACYDDPPARMLAPYSFAFDSSLAGLSWTLAVGGELRLLSDAERADVDRIAAVLVDERITHLDVVPSLYAALLARGAAGSNALPDLRVVICGGEALLPRVVQAHWRSLPGTRLFNEYGPTEATVFATVHEVERDVVEPITPIGTPIGDCECWVLDAAGMPAPIGHGGELYIGGPGVAAGYHDRPEENEARFVHRTLGARASVALYRTGDRCRYREDGLLELIGRADDQVQIRGHRVEPAEIELALRELPELADAAVVLQHSERDRAIPDARLVAYVVPTQDGATNPALIAAALKRTLPSYMIPSIFVPMRALPRSVNGKVDRAALPDVTGSVHALSEHVPPQTPLERELVAIFEELLGVKGLGMRGNFFDQGGHSLLAIALIDAIDKRLGTSIPLATFANDPTPDAIAQLIQGGAKAQRATRCIEIIHGAGEDVAFVFVGSTAQARRVAQHLAPTRRMFGLNLFSLHERGQEREVSIDWVVDEYLSELRSAQPVGPYAIAGYCDDAKIALAMAQRLHEVGEHVVLVALIDAVFFLEDRLAIAPALRDSKPAGPKKTRFNIAWVRQRLERLAKYGYDDLRRALARREHEMRKRLRLAVPLVLEHTMLFASYRAALEAYRAPSFGGCVALYVAGEWGLDETHLKSLHDIAVRQIPGFHETLFEGATGELLASAIQRDLEQADERARSPRFAARGHGASGRRAIPRSEDG